MNKMIYFALESEALAHVEKHKIGVPPKRHDKLSFIWAVQDHGQQLSPDDTQIALMSELETISLCNEVSKGPLSAKWRTRAAELAGGIRRRHLEEIRLGPVYAKELSRPFHLGRLCDAIDQIGTNPQRRIFWHGPRCGLTQTLMAATRLHQLSFAYAGPRRSLTEHVIAQLGGNVHPGDRLNAGTSVTGAYFLDGYVPNHEQWEHILTRVTPLASIFVFAEPYARDIENIRGRFLAELTEQGFTAGWA